MEAYQFRNNPFRDLDLNDNSIKIFKQFYKIIYDNMIPYKIYLFIQFMFYLNVSSFVCRYCLLFSISWKTKSLSIDSPIRILSSIIRGLSADNVYGLFALHIREHLSLTTSGQGLKIILKFDIAYPQKKKNNPKSTSAIRKKKKRSNRKGAGYKSRFNREPN